MRTLPGALGAPAVVVTHRAAQQVSCRHVFERQCEALQRSPCRDVWLSGTVRGEALPWCAQELRTHGHVPYSRRRWDAVCGSKLCPRTPHAWETGGRAWSTIASHTPSRAEKSAAQKSAGPRARADSSRRGRHWNSASDSCGGRLSPSGVSIDKRARSAAKKIHDW